ncbi:MAG: hypothetical protein AUI09_05295 [Gemmatimonadetes bacterium 13_2_20CM_2_66_5]|nr:MAG: hypothetical protein AUI09_05295 [Gemmatimonadetes bacterium 13_2_20CM_2_66_5]
MLARWVRLWFGFRDPVDRGTYFRHGAGLMALKYGIDALLIWRFAGRVWTPLNYLSPLLSTRTELLRGAPGWLIPLLVAIALPFLWIGVSMTMRRAADAGASPWIALLFFVPALNFVLMAVLSLLPSASTVEWPVEAPPAAVDDRLKSAMLGVAASLGISLITVAVGVYLRRNYSTGLFLGVPFTIGYICSYIYNYRVERPAGQSIVIALASVTIAAGALVLFALEGTVCTLMALPIALAIAFPGAVLGRIVARRGRHGLSVVTFPDLPAPTEALFRAGVAAPLRARIQGYGVGAVRYCDFTTGSFVEPITAWDENRLLAFDITEQAPPMTELSPYRAVHPPHLDGYFRATHGEFRLTPLPGGRTRLEGRTTYVVDMFPQAYWAVPARAIVTAIHSRVLHHIQTLAEELQ